MRVVPTILVGIYFDWSVCPLTTRSSEKLLNLLAINDKRQLNMF